MSEASPIGIALVGSGIFARREHLPAILATPSLSLKAVYSRTLESAATLTADLAQKVELYSDETAEQGRGYSDLLGNPEIKAVVIALPILTAPSFIRQALDAGKHVLSEKPIAPDSKIARELIDWYTSAKDAKGCSWSIAENWRFYDSHLFAAEQVRSLGRLLGFHIRRERMIKTDGEYFNTAWRKVPGHQGGFLLDGGIHVVAAIRMILGDANEVARVSAFTSQLQEHLPPVDTVNATLMTKSGVGGTFSVSSGTTFTGSGYAVACERGTVTGFPTKVVIEKDGGQEVRDFLDEGSGVKQEMLAWSKSIHSGLQDPRFTPEEGLKDLYALEAMLRSGENAGAPFTVET